MAKVHEADVAAAENLEIQRTFYGKKENLLLCLPVLLLLFGMLLLFFLLPKDTYSKKENKELPSVPEFSIEALKNGMPDSGSSFQRFFKGTNSYIQKFVKNTVSYVKGHFPFREQLVEVNAAYDLLCGRMQSNGIYLGNDGYLLEPDSADIDVPKFERTAAYIDSLLSADLPAVIAVPGNSSEVLEKKYPLFMDTTLLASNRALIDSAFQNKGYTYLNLSKTLSAHDEESIYFRTDHHWTALGAYYASAEILRAFGRSPAPLRDYRPETVMENFCGTYYNRSGLFFLEGEALTYLRYEGDEDYTVSFCKANGEVESVSHSLYDRAALEPDYEGTAYDSFVAPVTTPVVKIEKEGEERPTLLVLKDSYAHSTLSFLAQHYNLITVDIRKNLDFAAQLVKSGQVDALLILASSSTLLPKAES